METLLNYSFLILIPLFFLFFIASILFLIIRFFRSKSELKKWAESENWIYYEKYKQQAELHEFYLMIENSVQKNSRDKILKISNIIKGKYKKNNFWFCFYNGSSGYSSSINTRKSTNFNLFIIAMDKLEFDLTLIYRSKMIKFLHLDKLAKFLGMPLFLPEQKDIDWLLVTDIEQFNSLKLSAYQLQLLKENLEDAHSIILSKGFLVYAVEYNMPLKKKKIEYYLDNLEPIKKIFAH